MMTPMLSYQSITANLKRACRLSIVATTGLILATTLPATGFAQSDDNVTATVSELPDYVIDAFGEPPAVPTDPLSDEIKDALDSAFIDSVTDSTWGRDQEIAMDTINNSGDPRLAWIVSDMMRFMSQPGKSSLRAISTGVMFPGVAFLLTIELMTLPMKPAIVYRLPTTPKSATHRMRHGLTMMTSCSALLSTANTVLTRGASWKCVKW